VTFLTFAREATLKTKGLAAQNGPKNQKSHSLSGWRHLKAISSHVLREGGAYELPESGPDIN
jgi:hypothetical protein